MTIGLLGINFSSGNKGVAALAYSALTIITDILQDKSDLKIICFSEESSQQIEFIKDFFKLKEFKCVSYSIRNFMSLYAWKKSVDTCDIIFDFTGGDSFSDIYGVKRMLKVSLEKILIIHSKTKLVLAPQTYGPYKLKFSQMLFRYIVKHSDLVMARDEASRKLVYDETHIDAVCSADVAFCLPYDQTILENKDVVNIGVNVSKLLWNGGYSGNNQFGLKVDYKTYILELLQQMSHNGNYAVWLVPHVITPDIESEDDFSLCVELSKMYNVNLAPKFSNPMEAKSFIASLDVFTGARMHSTIAAISSNVAVIPFSYSKKFTGLYGSIEYPYLIDGKSEATNIAVQKTLHYIERREDLAKASRKSNLIAKKKNEVLYESFTEMINDIL